MLNAGKIVARGLVVYWVLPTAYAFAAADAGGNVSLVFSIIGVTATVGVTIAILVRFIGYLGSLKPAPTADGTMPHAAEDLDQSIEKELGDSFLPGAERKIAIRAMKKVLEKEVTKQVATVAKEMDEKYHATIREKNLEYSDIDKKYRNTLGYKKQTESVMRSIAEGLVVLNDKGEIMMLNPAAERLLGVNIEDEAGKPISESLKKEQLMSLIRKKDDAGGKELEINVKSDDVRKTIKSSSAVIEDDKGETIGMVSVLTDVTKQKELDELKAKFFSSVSHELRMPLVAIRNSIALMMDRHTGKLSAEQEKIVHVADRNLKRLRLLVDDILDFSKLEAKKVQLKLEPSSIEKIIAETCETFENWAQSRGIKILNKADKNIPEVKFDPDRITQVLSNLISNSIKFTPKDGTIALGATLEATDERKELVVTIEDTGPGIAEEDIPKLFGQYQQVGDRPSQTSIKGTGLGLHISRELVELHGGRIWVESELGKGSKFIFAIPA